MRFLAATLIGVLTGGSAFAQEPAPKAAATTEELVPDPTWIPKPSDQASLYTADGSGAYAAKDMFAYGALAKASKAQDDAGIDDLIEKKRIVIAPHLSRVLVIERHTNPYTTGNINALEVRFQDGPYKGQTAWVPEQQVERLITAAQLDAIKRAQGTSSGRRSTSAVMPRRKPKTFKPDRPANQASNAYRTARKLETDKKRDEAIKAYQAVIKDFAEFPESRLAKERIKALTGKD